jgi:hypothetical protein
LFGSDYQKSSTGLPRRELGLATLPEIMK